jgi:asparagine synthase (glutamine-hydrolysing)
MAWGIEVRTPLLSQAVCDYAMNTDPADKMIDVSKKDADGHPLLEKYLLRKAFDTPDDPYLPDDVLWRQKEQFSDGVGYDWVDGLMKHAEEMVSDEEFEQRAVRFPLNPPVTKEYYLLRSIFEEHFVTGLENGDCAYATVPFGKSIACSTPEAVAWDPEWEKSVGDISGRAVNVHDSSEGFSVAEDRDGSVSANAASTSAKSKVSALNAAPHTSSRKRFTNGGMLRVKPADGRRSQVGFSGARADRVRGFVGSRAALTARLAFA